MMDVGEMKRLWRVARFDFWIAMGAILAVLTAGVLAGVIIGVGLAFIIRGKANAGGTSLLGQLFSRLTRVPTGRCMLYIDAAIVLASVLVLRDRPAGGQIQLRARPREVEELARVQQRRARGPHVDLEGTTVEEPFDDIAELGPAHDGVLAEQQPIAFDQLLHWNELHFGDEITNPLLLRHEAPRPGGRVLHEGPTVGDSGRVGVADGMTGSRIGDAGDEVDLDVVGHAPEEGVAAVRLLEDRGGDEGVDGTVGREASDETLPGHPTPQVAVEPEAPVPGAQDLPGAGRRPVSS